VSEPRKEVLADGVEIWLGDCRDVLPMIGRVDAVVTDPPYGIGYAKYESHIDDPAEYPALIGEVTTRCEALLSDGWMCVFQAAKTAPEWHKWFPERQFRPLALPKTFVQILPCAGPTWATDYALVWSIGKPIQRGKSRDWFVCETSDMSLRPKGHPCPRPLNGITHVVDALSEQDDIVLDPFMGSGTTGVACINLGRKFIGIEREPKYYDIARRRIDDALRQPRMNFDPQPQPKQASMFASPEAAE